MATGKFIPSTRHEVKKFLGWSTTKKGDQKISGKSSVGIKRKKGK